MNLQIPLSPEMEAKLREQAEVAGKDVADFVREAVEEKLADIDDDRRADESQQIPADEWIARFRKWVASHRSLPYEAVDSRESIYAGRGE